MANVCPGYRCGRHADKPRTPRPVRAVPTGPYRSPPISTPSSHDEGRHGRGKAQREESVLQFQHTECAHRLPKSDSATPKVTIKDTPVGDNASKEDLSSSSEMLTV